MVTKIRADIVPRAAIAALYKEGKEQRKGKKREKTHLPAKKKMKRVANSKIYSTFALAKREIP